jgi:hypothetical protein
MTEGLPLFAGWVNKQEAKMPVYWNPYIDAGIAKKCHFWMETSRLFIHGG